jgi:hypothetical protein
VFRNELVGKDRIYRFNQHPKRFSGVHMLIDDAIEARKVAN